MYCVKPILFYLIKNRMMIVIQEYNGCIVMKLSTRDTRYIKTVLYVMVFLLSLGLIVYISIDTFTGVDFLKNESYMRFQLWVCVVFMTDFFIELFMADDKWRYIRQRWFFFMVSIPYLNIISLWHIDFSREVLYFLRFVPLVRGALALSIVIGYMTSNRLSSLLFSYLAIMLSVIYFASLIFLEKEQPVNNMVPDYGAALWWACMNATTIGCDIYPVTVAGKILAVILAGMGMMMFPLFTVYITGLVQRYNSRRGTTMFSAPLKVKRSDTGDYKGAT